MLGKASEEERDDKECEGGQPASLQPEFKPWKAYSRRREQINVKEQPLHGIN